jgi:ferredoxin-type protein NapH
VKRQRLRRFLIFISFLLFPITIYYLSPYLIIWGASSGIITGSFIVFCVLFLTALFLGRVFCSWLCPVGGVQESLELVNDKKARGGKFDWIKYIIWIPWVTIIIVLIIKAGGVRKVDFLYQTTNGISVAYPQAYIIYYLVLFLIIILSLTCGKRGFCHYACWIAPFVIIGTKIKNILNIPSLHLTADYSKCIDCKKCTSKCQMSLPVNEMVKRGSMKNSECVLCGECVDVCPQTVIKYSFTRLK